MVRRIREKIGSFCKKVHARMKWKREDELWSLYGGSCFGLFPPSFYRKHSEEEIQRLQQEEITKLKEIIQEFQKRNEGKAYKSGSECGEQ